MQRLELHPDRLFSSVPEKRQLARRIYENVASLPIISPHGHTDPSWFAENTRFSNAFDLLLLPDHYLLRMLISQGIHPDDLGLSRVGKEKTTTDPRESWRQLAKNYQLFYGTPSRMWLDWVFDKIFGLDVVLESGTSDLYFDTINDKLGDPDFSPRSLFDRFNIEVLTTTESPLDDLRHHKVIRDADWGGTVLTAYRPDPVVDPEFQGFRENVVALGELTGEDTSNWDGYLAAHRNRREFFKAAGATSTDHGHPTSNTADLDVGAAKKLFGRVMIADCSADDSELFRSQMLTEFAAMSLEDGLVMQIHPGSFRNHSPAMLQNYGRDMGFDIPTRTDYVSGLKPLLDRFGLEAGLTIILFTLDESSYSRELAPLAGAYPCLKLGPPWWFHDSPGGMRRFRELTTESAGFFNTVGFNDDTRAFMSIPARHDVARRIDCAFLADLVSDHRMEENQAIEVAVALAYALPKKAYRLGDSSC